MYRLKIFTFYISLFLLGCQENALDEVGEISCTEASGLWTLSRISCDGQQQINQNLVTYLFENNNRVVQNLGSPSCESTFDWQFTVGENPPTFDLLGQNNVTCSSNSLSVNSCSDSENSCNASLDFTGVINSFTTCVIKGSEMTLHRAVSVANNPDNLSRCSNGQQEELVLRQGLYTPTPAPGDENSSGGETLRAQIEVTNSDPLNFGTLAVGTKQTRQLNLTNTGREVASQLNTVRPLNPFHFSGGSFPGEGGTCQETLAIGESCELMLEFSPLQTGIFTGFISIAYFDGGRSQVLNHGLLGVGSQSLGGLLISNGPFYDFGRTAPGGASAHFFEITNAGRGPASQIQGLTLQSPFAYVGGFYPGIGGNCEDSLVTGASCTVHVEFSPNQVGTFNDRLGLSYSDGANMREVFRNIFGSSSN